MALQNQVQTGGRVDWTQRSDWDFSMSDTDSAYSDDDDSDDEPDMPLAIKRNKEMTLGGMVFNSSQLTANPTMEQSLTKLLSSQVAVAKAIENSATHKSEVNRLKAPKSPAAPERDPKALKQMLMSKSAPYDIKRVTSTSALESLNAKQEAEASSGYQYSTEMNVEDIMAMRNLIREQGGRSLGQFKKTKSLSAPDLTKTSFLTTRLMDEMQEEDSENSDDEDDDNEGESSNVKPRRMSASDFAKTSPDDYLHTIVKETFGECPDKVPSSDLDDYFLPITPDMISSYDMDVATAIRNEDLRVLSRMLRKGKLLQCCNRFGESIVHTVCRRGSTKLLQFLLDRAHVSMKVKCDYGRTPLHDACWTREPNFELIAIVVEECPDFLWMTDKRGFTPLNYVQKDQWGMWCVFLAEHKFLLKPKILA